jgi:hypothetical protein
MMNTFYATFGCGGLLRNHIIKVIAEDEAHAREQLHTSRLLQSCVAFIYGQQKGEMLIQQFKLTVIEGALM